MDPCRIFRITFALLLLPAAPALAESATTQAPPSVDEMSVIQSDAYLNSHPDLKFRALGEKALSSGNASLAYNYFIRAGHYADKLSMAAASELLWEGEGVEMNRPLAYAWMDIAAERGTPLFVGKREHYWRQLDPQQQKQAVEVGTELMDKYGDAAAKPRLERLLRQERLRASGSHLGSPTGPLKICITGSSARLNKGNTVSCERLVEGSTFYQEKFWKPGPYWAWQDAMLRNLDSIPRVDVGGPTPIKP